MVVDIEMDMKKQIHNLFGAGAIKKFNKAFAKEILALHKPDELWCAWCKKWGNHRSGNCPDKDCATIEKMFCDCGRPIVFKDYTQLDCVAIGGCKSTTPTVKPKRR